MLTVFLNIDGAILIKSFTPGDNFNNGYFCEKILEPLSQVPTSGRGAGSIRPIMHFDNATPHRSASTELYFQLCQFRHASKLPDSPDISPCNCFPFGGLKRKLKDEDGRAPSESSGVILYLVSSRRKHYNESMSTGSRDYSK
jgi:hypothetical protein